MDAEQSPEMRLGRLPKISWKGVGLLSGPIRVTFTSAERQATPQEEVDALVEGIQKVREVFA